jgi:hypothetical protein
MTEVVFGNYSFRIETRHEQQFIFDEVRKKWVVLTPEEWVRQHIIHYLLLDKKYPRALLAVEKGITINGLKRRFDIVVFDRAGMPKIIIECKAPEELLNEKVYQQIAVYNLALNADYLWVTNGALHFLCKLQLPLAFLPAVPDYEAL